MSLRRHATTLLQVRWEATGRWGDPSFPNVHYLVTFAFAGAALDPAHLGDRVLEHLDAIAILQSLPWEVIELNCLSDGFAAERT